MSRLTQADWIATGFRALATQGPQALKAEPLARALNTTKGSFYWHFKDVPAFQEHMLAFWEEKATQGMIALLDPLPSPEAKLRALSQTAANAQDAFGGLGEEPAIRAWAKSAASVADAVHRVDAQRLSQLSSIFSEMKMGNPDLPRLFYASMIGLQDIANDGENTATTPLATLVDLVIALSEND